jgi:ribosomal protein S18 acetylase RimI-like enzyme
MKRALRPATEVERAFCEALTRSNLSVYLSARCMPWNPGLYEASWREFENLMLVADDRIAGVLRLRADGNVLEIRDLQVEPGAQGQGIGSWAIGQAKLLAAERGFDAVRLRVFEENPAGALYARLGFEREASVDGKVQMACAVRSCLRRVDPSAATTGEQRT